MLTIIPMAMNANSCQNNFHRVATEKCNKLEHARQQLHDFHPNRKQVAHVR